MKPFFLLSILFICSNLNIALAQNKDDFNQKIIALSKEPDPAKSELVMNDLIQEYHLDSPEFSEEFDIVCGTVALTCLAAGKEDQFEHFVGKIRNKFNQTSYMNMGFEQIIRDSARREYAEALAKKTVLLYNSYKDDPRARPTSFPENDWNRFMRMAAYPYYHSYAQILHVTGKNEDALQFEEQALFSIENDRPDVSFYELYAQLLAIGGNTKKAKLIMLRLISKGKASVAMKESFKELYLKDGGTVNNYQQLVDSLQKDVIGNYVTELKNKMSNDVAAAEFELKDLEGKKVSLQSFHGKVIILDFWATWCQPCLASLPTMDKLRKKFPEVLFLFIATQEKGPGAGQRVKTFIQKHNYQFRVLMDRPMPSNPDFFVVSTAYKLSGIPAKVVIDKNGKQLFLTSGFSSGEELMNEMEAMIQIAKEK